MMFLSREDVTQFLAARLTARRQVLRSPVQRSEHRRAGHAGRRLMAARVAEQWLASRAARLHVRGWLKCGDLFLFDTTVNAGRRGAPPKGQFCSRTHGTQYRVQKRRAKRGTRANHVGAFATLLDPRQRRSTGQFNQTVFRP
jgi:hypothetical protein